MKISSQLYVTDSLARREQKLLGKLRRNRRVLRLFVITNASNRDNLFDIHYYNLLLRYPRRIRGKYIVYGIAETRAQAFALVERMMQDCLASQHNCDLRTFLKLPQKLS